MRYVRSHAVAWLITGLVVLALPALLIGCGKPTSPPPPPPQTGVTETPSGKAGTPTNLAAMKFGDPLDQYRSRWMYRLKKVNLSRDGEGIRLEITGGSDTRGGQYGGVKFPARAPKAIRLDLTFLNPANIAEVYVDGYGTDPKTQLVRWSWKAATRALPTERATYTFLPDASAGGFSLDWVRNVGAVQNIQVFARINPGSQAGFVLHKVEIAE